MANRSYLDTSALVKHYHAEAGTPVVDALFNSGAGLVISRLALVEVTSALALKVRTGEITVSQMDVALRRFHADVSQGVLSVARVLVRHFRDAERLLRAHAIAQRLRTLDALQIAVAVDLWRQQHIDQFVAADVISVDVAALEGLPTLNVLLPATP